MALSGRAKKHRFIIGSQRTGIMLAECHPTSAVSCRCCGAPRRGAACARSVVAPFRSRPMGGGRTHEVDETLAQPEGVAQKPSEGD